MSKKQLELNLYQGHRGGRRPGCGRKRIHSKGVAHRTREKVTHRTPVHINFKYRAFIQSKFCLKLLKRAIINARAHGLRIIHFSLQSNHVHLIIEAETNQILTRGMRSLTITFAKGLNKGKVQIDRYHLHVLKTIREAKHATHYVLFNQQKHERGIYSKIDEYSSLLSTGRSLELIKRFSRKMGMVLKIKKIDLWIPDRERSYLLIKGMEGLLS